MFEAAQGTKTMQTSYSGPAPQSQHVQRGNGAEPPEPNDLTQPDRLTVALVGLLPPTQRLAAVIAIASKRRRS